MPALTVSHSRIYGERQLWIFARNVIFNIRKYSSQSSKRAVQQHRPLGNGQVITMMRTTVGTQPQIIIVACCITLRRSAYDMEALRLCVYRRTVQ